MTHGRRWIIHAIHAAVVCGGDALLDGFGILNGISDAERTSTLRSRLDFFNVVYTHGKILERTTIPAVG